METKDEGLRPSCSDRRSGDIRVLRGLWSRATVIAFVGGTLPIVGIVYPEGLVGGLLWVFFGDPVLITVGYWIGMIVGLPIHALIRWLRERDGRGLLRADTSCFEDGVPGRSCGAGRALQSPLCIDFVRID